MVRKILSAASWLSLVQVVNTLSVIILSIVVIRRTDPGEVSSYVYAVFLTDAVMSYTLLQIAQRITLAKSDGAFHQLFAYSRRFGAWNASVAALVVAVVVLVAGGEARQPQTLHFVAWLALAGIANYFAQLYFSLCDYSFNYRAFGVSSSIANIASMTIAVAVFLLGGGIFSMVLRDVARSLILLALARRSVRGLAHDIAAAQPMTRQSKIAFLGFLVKRHALKAIEVSNHRVPALVTSAGAPASLAQFGVAFQLISQIMNVITIASDKVAYSFFSRGARRGRLRYLVAVVAINAVVGLAIFVTGDRFFVLIYGPRWVASATSFSHLGLYLFTHASLVVITNYLITAERFVGVYVAWVGWTLTFVCCYLFNHAWPVVTYYLVASAASFFLVLCALLWFELLARAVPPVAVPNSLQIEGGGQ